VLHLHLRYPAATFRELGPPDLCHVVKSTGRAGQRDVSPDIDPTTRSCIYNREQLGSYHYVSGIDTSSSASLAAYINSLTYSIEEPQAWFTKGPTWKVKNGCFWCVCLAPVQISSSLTTPLCPFLSLPIALDDTLPGTCSCFNAFSRVDVRVDVKIPGGVNAYVIDLRGERCVILPRPPSALPRSLWQTSSYPRHLARNIPLRHPSRHPIL
jgi:hypothetical protein